MQEAIPYSDIRRYWDTQSTAWSNPEKHRRLTTQNFAVFYQQLRAKFILEEYIAKVVGSDGELLDLASGALPTAYLPKDALPRLTAMDGSAKMLKHNPAARKVQGDIRQQLPFKDGSFAGVTMFFGNRYVGDHLEFMKSISRVLKAGGRFLFVDHSTIEHPMEAGVWYPQDLLQPVRELGFDMLNCTQLLPRLDGRENNIGDFYQGPRYLFSGVRV